MLILFFGKKKEINKNNQDINFEIVLGNKKKYKN